MGDEKQILRQRRRENLFELLGLLGDDRKQIEYGQSVGDKIAIDELQCMWFDDHYRADEPEFQTEYDKEELNALKKFNETENAEDPCVLILQNEYVDEPQVGVYVKITKKRITEWVVEWLTDSKREEESIDKFIETHNSK